MNSSRSRTAYWQRFAHWKRKLAQSVHSAVYNAAVGLSDDEIEAIVHDALVRARRDLSS